MGSRHHSRRKQHPAPPQNQVPHKFAVDERVLCYEPDMKKARVLYDSKVLEVVERNESKGKVTVEYKIHFFGWNASWDRYVAEECVLKDTDQNRQLQKELKAKADVLLQTHLKKKKRKKTLSEILKEATKGKTAKLNPSANDSKGDNDDQSRSSDSNESSDQYSSDDEEERKITSQIFLTDPVTTILEKDFYNITSNNMLVRLPAEISIVYVFEVYVKTLGLKELQKVIEKRTSNLHPNLHPSSASTSTAGSFTATSANTDKVQSKSNIDPLVEDLAKIGRKVRQAKEIVYGLRTIFDFMMDRLMLYDQENEQYKTYTTMQLSIPVVDCFAYLKNQPVLSPGGPVEVKYVDKKLVVLPNRDPGSLVPKSENQGTEHHAAEPKAHCSNNMPGPSSAIPKVSSCESLANIRIARYVKDLLSWKILPEDYYTEDQPDPSMVYGLIHMLRMFVKLPEILNRTSIPRRKIRIIANHVNKMIEHIETTYTFSMSRLYFTVRNTAFEEDRMSFGVPPPPPPAAEVSKCPEVKKEVDTDSSRQRSCHRRTSNLTKNRPSLAKVVEVPLSTASDALEEHQLTVSNEYICEKDALEICNASPAKEITKKVEAAANAVKTKEPIEKVTPTTEEVDQKPVVPKVKIEPKSPVESPRKLRQKTETVAPSVRKELSPPLLPMGRKMRKSAADSAFKTAHIFASQQNSSSRAAPAVIVKTEPVETPRKRPRSEERVISNSSKRVTRTNDRSVESSMEASSKAVISASNKNNKQFRKSPSPKSSPVKASRQLDISGKKSKESANLSEDAGPGASSSRSSIPAPAPRKTRSVSAEKKVSPTKKAPVSPADSKKLTTPSRRVSKSNSISKEWPRPGNKKQSPKGGSAPPACTTLRLRSKSGERQLRSKGALINALSLPTQASSRSSHH